MVNLAPGPNPCINQPTLSKLWWIRPLIPIHASIHPNYYTLANYGESGPWPQSMHQSTQIIQVMVNLAPGPNPCINQSKLSKLWWIWPLAPIYALIHPNYPSYGESGPWFQSMHQSTQITIRLQIMVNLAPGPNPCINQPTLSKLWWIWPLIPIWIPIQAHQIWRVLLRELIYYSTGIHVPRCGIIKHNYRTDGRLCTPKYGRTDGRLYTPNPDPGALVFHPESSFRTPFDCSGHVRAGYEDSEVYDCITSIY